MAIDDHCRHPSLVRVDEGYECRHEDERIPQCGKYLQGMAVGWCAEKDRPYHLNLNRLPTELQKMYRNRLRVRR